MTVRSTFRASLITPCVLGSVLAVPSASFAQTGISMSGATPAAGPTASQAPAAPPAAASASGAAPAPGVPPAPAPAPASSPAPAGDFAMLLTHAPVLTAGAPPVDSGQTPSGEADSDAEWIQRERALGEPTTLVGATGLLKTQHAETGAPGQFRLGFARRSGPGILSLHDQLPMPESTVNRHHKRYEAHHHRQCKNTEIDSKCCDLLLG